MKTRILASAVLASVALFGACSSPLPRGEDGVNALQFQDVVVPDGLRLVDDAHQSHSSEAGSYRQGRFLYMGQVRPTDAAAYVRQRMPLHNWELVADEAKDASTTRLQYRRGYYCAEYTFTLTEGRTQMVVDYTTEYAPR